VTGAEHYNYFRDYDPSIGRYVESDPIGLKGGLNTFSYVSGRPLRLVDAKGLKARICCRPLDLPTWVPQRLQKFQCFVDTSFDGPWGLHGDFFDAEGSGIPGQGVIRGGANPASFDNPGRSTCGSWTDECTTDDCVRRTIQNYPDPSAYNFLGTNSNTFAGTVAKSCKLSRPVSGSSAPGWDNAPAAPYSPPVDQSPG
jgi:uncharacterized protein RhaS with RHS repeats